MKIFSAELSSPQHSIAIWEDGEVTYERSWLAENESRQYFAEVLAEVPDASKLDWASIDVFLAGRGPGNYSGMRVALTALQGLALPGEQRVRALTSGAAVAARMVGVDAAPAEVVVLGDARRQKVWWNRWRKADGVMLAEGAWQLSDYEELEQIPADGRWVSAEYSRLAKLLSGELMEARSWHHGEVYPDAGTLATVWMERERRGVDPDPVEPLYLHPAVAVRPTK